ncbi:hypothetical protein D9M69_582910 [compost metagenome]
MARSTNAATHALAPTKMSDRFSRRIRSIRKPLSNIPSMSAYCGNDASQPISLSEKPRASFRYAGSQLLLPHR